MPSISTKTDSMLLPLAVHSSRTVQATVPLESERSCDLYDWYIKRECMYSIHSLHASIYTYTPVCIIYVCVHTCIRVYIERDTHVLPAHLSRAVVCLKSFRALRSLTSMPLCMTMLVTGEANDEGRLHRACLTE